jgi:Ca2+-binding RTX toxin-like protein
MVDKSRVSQLPLRVRNPLVTGSQDSFHFSQTALAKPAPIIDLQPAPSETVTRPGGLLLRTASALFPLAGRLADADAAANANTPMLRPSRLALSNEVAWTTVVAAAVGLSADAARADANARDEQLNRGVPNDSPDAEGSTRAELSAPAPAAVNAGLADASATNGPSKATEDALVVSGDDVLTGGTGSDTVVAPDAPAAVSHVGSSLLVIGGSIKTDTEQAPVDTGMQAPQGSLFVGTSGNDIMVGTGGDDIFYGGAGDDVIYGSGGDDYIDGGKGEHDTAVYSTSVEEAVFKVLSGHQNGATSTSPDGQTDSSAALATALARATDSPVISVSTVPDGADTLVNTEQLAFDDGVFTVVTAAAETHVAQGSAVNDIVIGSGAGDILAGGGGDDVLAAGSALDTAAFVGAVDDYHLTLSAHDNVVVQDSSDDRDGRDILLGVTTVSFQDNKFVLNGGTSGNDILLADTEPQLMVGGAGADIFVFNNAIMDVHRANAIDIVADFTQGEDRIDLHWITLDEFGDGFIWDGAGDAADGNSGNSGKGHLGYHMEQVETDWRTIVDGYSGQGNSDHHFDFHISLRGHYELNQSDFIL